MIYFLLLKVMSDLATILSIYASFIREKSALNRIRQQLSAAEVRGQVRPLDPSLNWADYDKRRAEFNLAASKFSAHLATIDDKITSGRGGWTGIPDWQEDKFGVWYNHDYVASNLYSAA